MQTVTAQQVIERAATIIADPAHWTTGTDARGANGETLYVDSPNAVRFCARGAVMKATLELTGQRTVAPVSMSTYCGCGTCNSFCDGVPPVFHAAMEKLDRHCGGGIVSVNDHLGHKAVMKAFAEAMIAHGPAIVYAVPEKVVAGLVSYTSVAEEVLTVEKLKLVPYVPKTPLQLMETTAPDYNRFSIEPTKKVALLATVS